MFEELVEWFEDEMNDPVALLWRGLDLERGRPVAGESDSGESGRPGRSE